MYTLSILLASERTSNFKLNIGLPGFCIVLVCFMLHCPQYNLKTGNNLDSPPATEYLSSFLLSFPGRYTETLQRGEAVTVGWLDTNTTSYFLLSRTMATDQRFRKTHCLPQQETHFPSQYRVLWAMRGQAFYLSNSGKKSMAVLSTRRVASESSYVCMGWIRQASFISITWV